MHRTLIESTVKRFTWEQSGWEDVVQNVFVKAITSIVDFKGDCRFSTWLYRIAVNETVDANRRHVRKSKRHDASDEGMDIFPDCNAADGLSDAIDSEIITAIGDILSGLPEGMKRAFELYYIEQQTGDESAEKLHISASAFFVRLSAARDRIKKELQKKGVVIC